MKYKLNSLLKTLLACVAGAFFVGNCIDAKGWQSIQEISRDAVVKIVAVNKDFNWFSPYASASPTQCTGTGFFINENGEIVTCAHVVDRAVGVFIMLPILGKQLLEVNVISICPLHDIALLQLTPESLAIITKTRSLSYLALGDSDTVSRGEEVITLGYPGTSIETNSLKSTTGIISARLNRVFQCDAPLNPGNSGGPLINKEGKVIGINSSVMLNAQNSNFAVPINTFKSLESHLRMHKILRIQNFGIMWSPTNQETRKHLKAFDVEGCLLCDHAPFYSGDLSELMIGDLIYKVNGYDVDSYGEIKALHNDEKMKFDDYITLLPPGPEINFDVYRDQKPLRITITLAQADCQSLSCEYKYPAYQEIEYELFAGMVIMPLTVNYIKEFSKNRPSLQRYLTNLYDQGNRLVIASIIPDSHVARGYTMRSGDTINEINGEKVYTMQDWRTALQKSIDTGIVIITTTDEFTLKTDNVLTVLSLHDSCKETVKLSRTHRYPLSQEISAFIKQVDESLLAG